MGFASSVVKEIRKLFGPFPDPAEAHAQNLSAREWVARNRCW
jgi:hypothetical protein